MSWFFGSKKKVEEPPKSTDPDPVSTEGKASNEYNSPIYPRIPPEALPYQIGPTRNASLDKGVVLKPHNPLDSVPFRLAPALTEEPTTEDLEIIHQALTRINNDLNSNSLSYDFSAERSIVREANLCNGSH